MNVLEFWEKIGLPKRLIEKTLQLNVTEKEYNRLYRIYQEDHESFFLEVLKKRIVQCGFCGYTVTWHVRYIHVI